MRASRKLLRRLGKIRGVNTDLFVHEAEWELADAAWTLFLSDDKLKLLEQLDTK